MFWDIGTPLSYNCLFNFIVGPRGAGKTYGFKNWAIKDFLKTGHQFIYLRRYKTELRATKTFFADIQDQYPEVDFKVRHNEFVINDKVAGIAFPLSTAKVQKSSSFPKVNKICFDEFVIDKGVYHYLPDEVINFLEFYETIARMREVKVFFLSNAITMANPYFIYFALNLPYGKDISAKNDKLIQHFCNDEYLETKEKTRFGQLIKGTQYGDYAMKNEFLRDNTTFVQHKTPHSEYYFSFTYGGEKYGVWIDYVEGLITISEDVDESYRHCYAFTASDHTPNTMLLKGPNRNNQLRVFIANFKMGNMRFESVKLKNIVMDIMRWT